MIYAGDVINIFGSLLAFFIYVMCFFSDSLLKKLSVVIVLHPAIISTNFLFYDFGLSIYLAHQDMSVLNQNIMRAFFLLLQCLLWFIIFKLSGKWNWEIQNLTPKMWLIIDLLSLSSFVGILTILSITPVRKSYLSYPGVLACLLTSVGSLYLTAYISKSIKAEEEKKNLMYQQSYYLELEQNQRSIRKLRHDMNNHLNVIGSFIRDRNLEDASAYFSQLSDTLEGVNQGNKVFCNNSILNALLNAKYALALEKEIDTFVNISIDGLIGIDDISLCSLFANTLDNAIEANQQIEDRKKRTLSLKAAMIKGISVFNYPMQKQMTY
ncbi:two-component system sensor histidine kinase AgrC [Aequitasia blattaphilus]